MSKETEESKPATQTEVSGASENGGDHDKESGKDQSGGKGQEPASGLPFGFIAIAAAAFFLYSNKEKLSQEGGFIYIIGAIFLGLMSANMLSKR